VQKREKKAKQTKQKEKETTSIKRWDGGVSVSIRN
jgi:hypothetical protein